MYNNLTKQYGLLVISMLLAFQSIGQGGVCHSPTSKAQKLYSKAIQFWNNDIYKGKTYIYKCIKADPAWAKPYFYLAKYNYRQAQKCKFKINEIENVSRFLNLAATYFEKTILVCNLYSDYDSYYYLAKIYYDGKDYTNAYGYIKKYITPHQQLPKKHDAEEIYKRCLTYIQLKNNPIIFSPTPVNGVCSPNDEFLPLIAPDNSFILFTRRYWKQKIQELAPKLIEEFSVCQFKEYDTVGNPIYYKPTPMPYPFNDATNQGAATITIDNKIIYITICKQTTLPNGRPYKNCDIYKSEKINNKWTNLEPLEQINTPTTWEGQPSISADGKSLYFASYRPHGIGGIDIYVSTKDSAGKWLKPINLGIPINTEKNERTPFIHPDNKTLYYASDGIYGMGGYDIFVSRKQNGIWQKPINIGYPINSEEDEAGFVVSTNGTYAYFSSNMYKGIGGYDIFSFELPKSLRPDKVFFIKGQMLDGQGIGIKNAHIEIENIKTREIQNGLVDNNTGNYAVAVNSNQNDIFLLTVKKRNYTFSSKLIQPSKNNLKKPIKINLTSKIASKGTKVRLNNVLFESNSSQLTKLSKAMLRNFAKYLTENPALHISVEGHTDSIADSKYNLSLSIERAKKVYKYLVHHGIKKRRLSFKGYGETKPISTNKTEEGKKLNRRTEFTITKSNIETN